MHTNANKFDSRSYGLPTTKRVNIGHGEYIEMRNPDASAEHFACGLELPVIMRLRSAVQAQFYDVPAVDCQSVFERYMQTVSDVYSDHSVADGAWGFVRSLESGPTSGFCEIFAPSMREQFLGSCADYARNHPGKRVPYTCNTVLQELVEQYLLNQPGGWGRLVS